MKASFVWINVEQEWLNSFFPRLPQQLYVIDGQFQLMTYYINIYWEFSLHIKCRLKKEG